MQCSIRKWEIGDAPELAAALNNKNIHDNVRDGLPYPYTEKDATAFIESMLSADQNKDYSFAIIAENRVVGSVGVHRKDNIHRKTAEMGYYVSQEHWGKGIGASAVKQACQYIFEHTDIVRIFAEPFIHNIASCKILEKNGFVCEGILRSNAIKNGEIVDMKMYALIKSY